MDERAEDDGAQRDPDREDPVVVRLDESVEEPEITDGQQQDAGAVFGTPPERDEAAGDEAEARGERERERGRGIVLVFAREDEPRRAGCEQELRPQPRPQGSSSAHPSSRHQRRSGELVLRDEAACAALRHRASRSRTPRGSRRARRAGRSRFDATSS